MTLLASSPVVHKDPDSWENVHPSVVLPAWTQTPVRSGTHRPIRLTHEHTWCDSWSVCLTEHPAVYHCTPSDCSEIILLVNLFFILFFFFQVALCFTKSKNCRQWNGMFFFWHVLCQSDFSCCDFGHWGHWAFDVTFLVDSVYVQVSVVCVKMLPSVSDWSFLVGKGSSRESRCKSSLYSSNVVYLFPILSLCFHGCWWC